MEYPYCVMKIMASWMTLYELDGTKKRIDFIYISGTNQTKHFKYRHPFRIILGTDVKWKNKKIGDMRKFI